MVAGDRVHLQPSGPHFQCTIAAEENTVHFLLHPRRNCLLHASRPLGLTLRHSGHVCCCHRDSFTRWRLAFAQEPRVLLLLRPPICSFESQCAFTHCDTYLLSFSQFSIIKSALQGHAKSALSCIISSSITQWPEDFYGVVSTCQQYQRQETVIAKKNPSSPSVPS